MNIIFIEEDNSSYFKFSGGEIHCKLSKVYGHCRIICRDYTAAGFMAVCMHNEVFRRNGASRIELVYPYLPYARQDRVMQETEPFSLQVFARMINAQNFDSVTVYDPHSDVGPALIERCKVISQWEIAKKAIGALVKDENIIFVSPDAGAYKKVSKLMTDDSRIAIATKIRDPQGNIAATRLASSPAINGRTCVIVDDICDGGRTFIELAKVLKEAGAGKVILYITHGIFSHGFSELEKHVDEIVTTNSIKRANSPSFLIEQEIDYAY